MLALERKVGVLLMIEISFLPAFGIVALLAVVAIAALVFVIFFMAGDAILLGFLSIGSFAVAGITGRVPVPANQLEFSIPAVIKTQLFPFVAGMALVTLVTVFAVMDIIDQMAGAAFFGCVLVYLSCMAELARHLFMTADQLIFRILVVIKLLLFPVLLVMAFVTLFSQRLTVRIIGLMAVETARRCLAEFFQIVGMA